MEYHQNFPSKPEITKTKEPPGDFSVMEDEPAVAPDPDLQPPTGMNHDVGVADVNSDIQSLDADDTTKGDAGRLSLSPSNTPPITNVQTPNSTLMQFNITTPVRRSSSPGNRDYKTLYGDLKLRTLEYARQTDEKLAMHKDNYDNLAVKYEREMESQKFDYEEIIANKGELLAEKVAEIAALQDKLATVSTGQPRLTRNDGEEVFKTKARKNKCQFSSCTNDNEDALIKCNACGVWVCETCNDVPISKLRPVMNKCSAIYFVCKTCNDALHNSSSERTTTEPGMTKMFEDLSKDHESLVGVLHATKGELSTTVLKLTDSQTETKRINAELLTIQKNEIALRGLLQEREDELDEAQIKLNAVDQSPDTTTASQASERLLHDKNKLEKELLKRDADLKRTTVERTQYQKQRLQLNQTVAALEKEDVEMKTRLKSQAAIIKMLREKAAGGVTAPILTKGKEPPAVKTKETDPATIDTKLEAFSTNLLTKVTQIVDEKLGTLSVNLGTSYADKTRDVTQQSEGNPKGQSPPQDFARVMRETKNDELVEEQERTRRANNLIVYGMSEDLDGGTVPLKSKDDFFITSLMEVLQVDVVPSAIVRLGKPNPGKHRPVRLTMSCANDKESIMANLKNLKNADTIYHSLSIRDDYTIKERELISRYAEDAKKKNVAENTTEWKVRGTPKNGLRLVRITKR